MCDSKKFLLTLNFVCQKQTLGHKNKADKSARSKQSRILHNHTKEKTKKKKRQHGAATEKQLNNNI